MKSLRAIDIDMIKLVNEITSRVKSSGLKQRYIQSAPKLEGAKTLYVEHLANHREKFDETKSLICEIDLPASKDEMKKLYSSYFVGSTYYSKLKVNAEVCPYCEIERTSTLDHYLPQKYSALTVVPQNLIPACRDCNTQKHSSDDDYFHPYFDDVNWDSWLAVTLEFDKNIIPVFHCQNFSSLSVGLFDRIELTVAKLNLLEQYQRLASAEITENIRNWKYYVAIDQSILEVTLKNLMLGSLKCWKSALYKELLNQKEELYNFVVSLAD